MKLLHRQRRRQTLEVDRRRRFRLPKANSRYAILEKGAASREARISIFVGVCSLLSSFYVSEFASEPLGAFREALRAAEHFFVPSSMTSSI